MVLVLGECCQVLGGNPSSLNSRLAFWAVLTWAWCTLGAWPRRDRLGVQLRSGVLGTRLGCGDPGGRDRVDSEGCSIRLLPAGCLAHPPWAKLVVPNAPGSYISSRTCWSKKKKRGDMMVFVSPHTLRSEFSSPPRILHEPEKGCGASCSKPSELRSIVRAEPSKGNSV